MSRTIVVTGASRGIGAGIVTLAARNGYSVCVNYETSASAAEELLTKVSAYGGKAIAIRADVASEE